MMMLEEDSWADASNYVFPNTSSENSGTLDHCFKHTNIDSIDREFCHHGPISLADDDLSFLDDNLSYNWSEIGNFEDVDMMFSCDSMFGLGAGNEDDLAWSSSSDAIEGSADGLRADFKLQNPASSMLEDISGRGEVSRTKETGSSVSDSGAKSHTVSYNDNLLPSQKDESPNLSHVAFVNGSSNSECKLVAQKIDINKKHENQSEGKRKGVYLENDDALQHSGIKFENNSQFEGIDMTNPAEFGSSLVLESTSMSSGLDEIAEEVAGFHQLQRVTEQLDVRTKLCMRDSLYRLARSAEQRHRDANVNNGSGDDIDRSQASISGSTNKRKEYMDVESDTNPIDRSIAHLLFLKSSRSSVTPT